MTEEKRRPSSRTLRDRCGHPREIRSTATTVCTSYLTNRATSEARTTPSPPSLPVPHRNRTIGHPSTTPFRTVIVRAVRTSGPPADVPHRNRAGRSVPSNYPPAFRTVIARGATPAKAGGPSPQARFRYNFHTFFIHFSYNSVEFF